MDPIVHEQASSSGAGRAIDRHNPIIRDEKRLTKKKPTPAAEDSADQKRKSIAFSDDDEFTNIKNTTTPPVDFTSSETSSRCLLSHDKAMFRFPPEFDTAPALAPYEASMSMGLKKKDEHIVSDALTKSPPSPPCEPVEFCYSKALKKKDEGLRSSSPAKLEAPPCEAFEFLNGKALEKKDDDSLSSASPEQPSPPPSTRSSDQVVVLEVSLHCRGCERKMRKHISKIEGVRSFKIEFADKKVTVVGDVTPLAVLTSVLKVKNAKLLTPATMSSPTDNLLTDLTIKNNKMK